MGLSWAENLQHIAVNTSTSGNNTLIAAPGAGKYLAIDFITLNPDGGGQTLIFKSGSTELFRLMLDDNQPLTYENAIQHPKGIITCADNEEFVLNLGAAQSVTGFIRYRIVE